MNESHQSLRDDFEVSSEALDLISECARESPGCYGARMTGGGFAGGGVALVDQSRSEEFSKELERKYKTVAGRVAKIYLCSPSEGAESFKI